MSVVSISFHCAFKSIHGARPSLVMTCLDPWADCMTPAAFEAEVRNEGVFFGLLEASYPYLGCPFWVGLKRNQKESSQLREVRSSNLRHTQSIT